MTTKCGEPEISIGVMFEFCHDVIVDFDMGRISRATESRSGATLVVIQVGDHYKWVGVPQQGASGLSQAQRAKPTEIRSNNRITDE